MFQVLPFYKSFEQHARDIYTNKALQMVQMLLPLKASRSKTLTGTGVTGYSIYPEQDVAPW